MSNAQEIKLNTMTKINKLIIIVLCSLLVVFLYSAWAGVYSPKDAFSTQSQLFLVERGQGLFQIAENLEEQGIIKNNLFFIFYVTVRGNQTRLQAGEYLVSPSMNVAEISEKIISGDIPKDIITIHEGWNLRDIAWYFEGKGMFQAEELFELVGFPLIDYSKSTDLPQPKNFSGQFDFLKDKPNILSLEGYLFPDTYELNRGMELESIVKKILDNQKKEGIATSLHCDVLGQHTYLSAGLHL